MATLWVLGAVALMFALVYLMACSSTLRTEEHAMCPVHEREVDITFERRFSALWGPGEKSDVLACSAFDVPDQVTCDKVCLKEPALVHLGA